MLHNGRIRCFLCLTSVMWCWQRSNPMFVADWLVCMMFVMAKYDFYRCLACVVKRRFLGRLANVMRGWSQQTTTYVGVSAIYRMLTTFVGVLPRLGNAYRSRIRRLSFLSRLRNTILITVECDVCCVRLCDTMLRTTEYGVCLRLARLIRWWHCRIW